MPSHKVLCIRRSSILGVGVHPSLNLRSPDQETLINEKKLFELLAHLTSTFKEIKKSKCEESVIIRKL